MRRRALGWIFSGLSVALFGGAFAVAEPMREHDAPAEYRYPGYTGVVPPCSDPGVLFEIQTSFQQREADYWNSGLAIVAFESTSEFGYRSTGWTYIPRRYCRADALFNDGKRRRIVYNIGEALGFIGIGPGVTWCVVGLDRNHAFSPNCRAAGP